MKWNTWAWAWRWRWRRRRTWPTRRGSSWSNCACADGLGWLRRWHCQPNPPRRLGWEKFHAEKNANFVIKIWKKSYELFEMGCAYKIFKIKLLILYLKLYLYCNHNILLILYRHNVIKSIPYIKTINIENIIVQNYFQNRSFNSKKLSKLLRIKFSKKFNYWEKSLKKTIFCLTPIPNPII